MRLLVAVIGVVTAAVVQGQTVERNLVYAPNGVPEQTLDVYRPPGVVRYPTVIFIHGGSLVEAGERRGSPVYASLCPAMVQRGIGCVAMDYRLSPSYRWPAMIEDVGRAVRWTLDSIAARGGDPSRLFLVGHSSGCLLAAVLATDARYLAAVRMAPKDLAAAVLVGCTLAPRDTSGLGLTPDRVRQAFARDTGDVRLWGSVDARLEANPTRFVGAHVPPILVIVAEGERFAPPILEQGARFVRLILRAGRPADLVVLLGVEHMTTTTEMTRVGHPLTELLDRFVRSPKTVLRGTL